MGIRTGNVSPLAASTWVSAVAAFFSSMAGAASLLGARQRRLLLWMVMLYMATEKVAGQWLVLGFFWWQFAVGFTTVHSFWLECCRSKGRGLAPLDYDGPGAGSSVLCVGKRHCILDDCIQRIVNVEAFWNIPGGM